MIVYANLNDVKACKMCCKGAREFFARHGLDYDAFRDAERGIDAMLLIRTGDHMAAQVAAHACGRVGISIADYEAGDG